MTQRIPLLAEWDSWSKAIHDQRREQDCKPDRMNLHGNARGNIAPRMNKQSPGLTPRAARQLRENQLRETQLRENAACASGQLGNGARTIETGSSGPTTDSNL